MKIAQASVENGLSCKSNESEDTSTVNRLKIFSNVSVEKKKPKFEETIREEYTEKIELYGYLMVCFIFYV